MNNEIIVKDGVVFKKINLPALDLFDVMIRCGNLLNKDMVITSANDGDHHGNGSNNSLHYENLAWDVRTHHLTGQEQLAMEQFLKAQLGSDWDILLEGIGSENVHEHIEFDPK